VERDYKVGAPELLVQDFKPGIFEAEAKARLQGRRRRGHVARLQARLLRGQGARRGAESRLHKVGAFGLLVRMNEPDISKGGGFGTVCFVLYLLVANKSSYLCCVSVCAGEFP